MKIPNKTFLIFAFFLTFFSAQAQYKTLVLNYEKSCFGENEPLPAQSYFVISGVANVPYVEIIIYTAQENKTERKPVYHTTWKREMGSQSPKFTVPINQKLRENKNYDLLIKYYRSATAAELDSLQIQVFKTLDAYVEQSFKVSDQKIDFQKSVDKMVEELSEIVLIGMSQFRPRTSFQFHEFSDLVEMKIKQLEGINLAQVGKANAADPKVAENRILYRNTLLNELKAMLHTEVRQYLHTEFYIMVDDKWITDYPTERLQNYLPVNFGYGGALIEPNFDDFDYVASTYLGLSFPFGKEGGDSKFLSHTSLSIGVILDQNLFDQDGSAFTGPIFKVPAYVALGYRAFRFIRINAGATVLEDVATSKVNVFPFVGVCAEFNLSLSLSKD